jgi:hypothetical protein
MRVKLIVPALLCLLAIGATPARAADPPAWHTAFPATEGSPAEGVSCGTDTFCMAVGGIVAVEDDGPIYETNPDGAGLNSVSCAPGTHFCVAVDVLGRALKYTGGEFGAVEPISSSELESVSCPAVGRCMAVRHTSSNNSPPMTVYRLDDGGWDGGTALPVATPAGISGSSEPRIACATTTVCIVVANTSSGERYWTTNGSIWTEGGAITGRAAGDNTVSISCTSTTFCLSTSKTGKASLFNGSSWSTQQVDDTSHGLKQMASSCFGTTCRAITAGNYAYRTTNGTAWTPNNPPNIGASTLFGGANSMSCPSANTCVATDGGGNATTYGLSIVPRQPPVISGTGAVGQTLSIATHSLIDNPRAWFFPEWWRCDNPGSTCTQIPDEHGNSYTLTEDDVGKYVDVLEGTGIGLDEELFRERSNNIAVPAPSSPTGSTSTGSTSVTPGSPSGAMPGTTPRVVAPALAKASTSKKGVVTLPLTCPAGVAPCTGKVGLSFKAGKKRKSAGSEAYSIAAGKTAKVKVDLLPAARELLESKHELAVVLTVKPAGGKTTTRNLELQLPR